MKSIEKKSLEICDFKTPKLIIFNTKLDFGILERGFLLDFSSNCPQQLDKFMRITFKIFNSFHIKFSKTIFIIEF